MPRLQVVALPGAAPIPNAPIETECARINEAEEREEAEFARKLSTSAAKRTRVASLRSIVAFERFANCGQDRVDLERLERVHGELPAAPLPEAWLRDLMSRFIYP